LTTNNSTRAAICDHGGITGRGILLDYAEWASKNSISVSALTSEAITLENLQKVAKDHNLNFQKGDILFIRSGFTEAYNKLNNDQRKQLALRPSPDFNGVEATEEMVRWLWEKQFAAVAGDAPSFERAPIRGVHADSDFNLHEWVLAGWGTPIGEMFDLEGLSRHCKEIGRYSFFLSSMPLKVSLSVYLCRWVSLIASRLLAVSLARRMLLLFSDLMLCLISILTFSLLRSSTRSAFP
jgi:kynurenine formamidase